MKRRNIRLFRLPILLLKVVSALWMTFIPGMASDQSSQAQGSAPGAIQGTVKDASGSAVADAIVTLESAASTDQRTAITDQTGCAGRIFCGAQEAIDARIGL
jgi:hypothetical protein